MIRTLAWLWSLGLMLLACQALAAPCADPVLPDKSVSVLVVTGNHAFEPLEFFDALRGMQGLRIDHAMIGTRGTLIAGPKGGLGRYDVVLFYDHQKAIPTITPHWRDLIARGTGLVFLHHALASFPQSAEMKAIAGGQARLTGDAANAAARGLGTFHAGERQRFTIVDPDHPVTCGIQPFEMEDEAYDGLEMEPGVVPLVRSSFPRRTPVVGWAWMHGQQRVGYLQPGHGSIFMPLDQGPTAFDHPEYLKLLRRYLLWAAGRI
jgi:type 1 glutamine amidotransferase